MQTLTEELCACRKELEARTTAIKRAAHDREELAKDKAALDVKLNSAERKACGLTQELVALRSELVSVNLLIFERLEEFHIYHQFSQNFFGTFWIHDNAMVKVNIKIVVRYIGVYWCLG